jgi:hypothetical protein
LRSWLLAVATLAAASWGNGTSLVHDADTAPATDMPPAQPKMTATATVLQDQSHGPQLCLSGVRTSLPPQCGGPDLVGWDWAAALAHEERGGTTWVDSVTVVGVWDGPDERSH